MFSSISIPEAAPLDATVTEFRITRRLLGYAWRYRWLLFLLILSTGAMAAFAGYLVVLVKQILDVLKDTDSQGRAAVGSLQRLGWQALALTPAAALAYGGAWLCGQQLANAATRDMRNDLLAHLVQLDLGFHQRMSRGDLLSRMTSDVETTGELFGQLFGKLLQRPAEALGTIVFLFYVNWQFSESWPGFRRWGAV